MARRVTKKTAPRARRKAARKRPPRRGEFPQRIFAIASPRSVGGVSIFEPGLVSDVSTISQFLSDPDTVQRAVYRLQDAGFEVLQVNQIMINIAGSRDTYEKAFNTTLVAEERPTIKERGREDKATFLDCPDTTQSGLIATAGTRFEDVLEGVALEEPRYLMQSPFAPPKAYWHLDVPGDVSLGCNADRAHRDGITGRGIRVAMVDTGWYRHPYFVQRGYRAQAVVLGPGTADPTHDEVGHGTGESANLFAVAPDVELLPVKAMLAGTLNNVLVNSTAAFNTAVGLNPDIITNSWGFSVQNGPLSAAQQALAAACAAAVASGIVVVFSAGNGHWGFPGQHPDVISAGGVYMGNDGSMRASDYASGFMSNVYPGRRVPDVSGLVGMRPGAQYIMLPVESGDEIDTDLSGGTHPNGDETATNDGWAAFSGTSAAAPQVAGVAALIKQACRHLSPAEVKDILMSTARDVTAGRNHPNFNNPAVVGPDTATGNGLADAMSAVLVAKLRCMVIPIRPLIPLLPVSPLLPLLPLRPLRPLFPLLPLVPVQPTLPLFPLTPLRPLFPVQPLIPIQPFLPLPGPIEPPIQPGPPLSAENVRQLEEMIIRSRK
jgi:subtilisin family serine protease